ncbi:unnamed protein product [Larinioides sclopetarius]|uniref:Peptidase aspartic putative domain-containing protein n=1 Tax=Larinioides sclopetarius TaxID=280406 RepID=A0AAV1ZTG3_9ARAC
MFKGARKEDLKQIASELSLEVNEKDTLWDIIELIKNSERYREKYESVKEVVDLVIDERKRQEQSQVSNCKSKVSCHCKKRHHKSLHFHRTDESRQPVSVERNKQENRAPGDSQNRGWSANAVNALTSGGEHSLNVNAPDFVQGSSLTFMSNNCNRQQSALLSTAVCYLIDESGKQVRVRCLLDAGSQMSFLKRDCVEMLGLKKEKTNILVSGLNDSSIPIKSRVTAVISNENKSYVRSLDFLVVPKITAVDEVKPTCAVLQFISWDCY